MAKKNIRVETPTASPDSMISLSEAITEKHETYAGSESPLHHMDMDAFKKKTEMAKKTLASMRTMDNEAQDLIQEANTIMGFSEGQTSETEGTLYFTVDKIRLTLLGDSTGNEEELQKYGFNVVVGETRGRKTSRIELPIGKHDKFLTLCKDITTKHEAMGVDSPLHHLDMDEFKKKTTEASKKLKEGRKLHKDSEPETEKAYQLIGIGKGQNLQSEGTIYFTINKIKKILLGFYKGVEEQLQLWGFNVVITETLPGRKTKRVTVIIPKSGIITILKVADQKKAKNIGKTILAWHDSANDEPIALQPDEEMLINTPSGSIVVTNRSPIREGRIRLDVTK